MPIRTKKIVPIADEPVVETVEEPVIETVEEPIPEPVEESIEKIVDTECLNVRRRVGGDIIGHIYRNQVVVVDSTRGEWSKISSPVNGYCMSQYLK